MYPYSLWWISYLFVGMKGVLFAWCSIYCKHQCISSTKSLEKTQRASPVYCMVVHLGCMGASILVSILFLAICLIHWGYVIHRIHQNKVTTFALCGYSSRWILWRLYIKGINLKCLFCLYPLLLFFRLLPCGPWDV